MDAKLINKVMIGPLRAIIFSAFVKSSRTCPAAFLNCTSLTGKLVLPSTLKILGSKDYYQSYHDGVFYGCNFVCELVIPESVEVIGAGTFGNCKNLYGEIRLPDGLK